MKSVNFEVGQEIGERYTLTKEVSNEPDYNDYQAHDRQTNKPVTLRIVEYNEGLKEALIGIRDANLEHPNIASIIEISEESGCLIIATYFLDGVSLSSFLRDNEKLSPREAAQLCEELIAGIDYAHTQGIPHRNISPENIYITDDNHPIITNFMLPSKDCSGYLAPEQGKGRDARNRSDYYSLALIIFDIILRSGTQLPIEGAEDPSVQQFERELETYSDEEPRRRPSSLDRMLSALQIVQEMEPAEAAPTIENLELFVVNADMSQYSLQAKRAHDSGKTKGVSALDQKIATLISDSVAAIGEDYLTSYRNTTKKYERGTGDGAILFFHEAWAAHKFASNLHSRSSEENTTHTSEETQVHFRISIAYGNIEFRNTEPSTYDLTIAERLQAMAMTGEILISENTYQRLAQDLKQYYGPMEQIPGKHEQESFKARRYRLNTPSPQDKKYVLLSYDAKVEDRAGNAAPDATNQAHNFIASLAGKYAKKIRDQSATSHFLFDTSSAALRVALASREYAASRNAASSDETIYISQALDLALTHGRPEPPEEEISASLKRVRLLTGKLDWTGRILLLQELTGIYRTDKRSPPSADWVEHGDVYIKGSSSTADDESIPFALGEVGDDSSFEALAIPAEIKTGPAMAAESQAESNRWLPAIGKKVRGVENWQLHERLGEGGFGEVWLAVQFDDNHKITERTIFKFSKSASGDASLRREVKVLRAMEGNLDRYKDFVAELIHADLDNDPPYLQYPYARHGNLETWAESQGGLINVPLNVKYAILRQVIKAVNAAHSVAIIHGDIKPSNILIYSDHPDDLQVRLNDFGIGQVMTEGDREQTAAGGQSSATATWDYAAPELRGAPQNRASMKSDIYAFGILFYQVIAGSFHKSATVGWQENIHDGIVISDLKEILNQRPELRPESRVVLKNLQNLDARRAAIEKKKKEKALQDNLKEIRKRKEARRLAAVMAGLFAATLVGLVGVWHFSSQLQEKERQYREALNYFVGFFEIADPTGTSYPGQSRGRDITAKAVLDISVSRIEELSDQPYAYSLLLKSASDTYRSLGDYDQAETLIRRVVEIHEEGKTTASLGYASALNSRGLLSFVKTRYEAAKKDFYSSYKIAENHDDRRLASEILMNIAMAHAALGEYTLAEKMSIGAVDMRKAEAREGTKSDQAEYASALAQRADIITHVYMFKEAEQLLEEALSIQKEVLGLNHPHTAATKTSLAMIDMYYYEDYERAATRLEEVEDMNSDFYGGPHQDRVATLGLLGAVYSFIGDTDRAGEYLDDAKDMQRKMFKTANHIGTADILIKEAIMQEAMGNFDSADGKYGEALAIQIGLLGDEHRLVAMTLTYRASNLWSKGDLDRADFNFNEANDIFKSSLADESGDRAQNLNLHGLLLVEQGKIADALLKFEESLKIRKVYLEDLPHMDTAEVYNNIALVHYASGNFKEAEPQFWNTLDAMQEVAKGSEPSDIKRSALNNVMGNLAFVLIEKGDQLMGSDPVVSQQAFREAEGLLMKALGDQGALATKVPAGNRMILEVLKEVPAREKRTIARILKNLGFLAEREERDEDALYLYESALKIREDLLGKGHPDVAKVLVNQARLAIHRGDIASAKSNIGRAIEIFDEKLPQGHWHTWNARSIKGACLVEEGKFEDAEQLLLGSLPVLGEEKGGSSFYRRDTLKRLIRLYDEWEMPGKKKTYQDLLTEAPLDWSDVKNQD